MTLLWPQALWLLLLCPALILAGQLNAFLRRTTRRETVPTSEHIRQGSASAGRVRFDRVLKGAVLPWRFWLAFALVILALARPQWGRQEAPPGSQTPGEVFIALDLSRSMLAADAAPSRLERARAVATRLVDQVPDRKIGLIAFAQQAYVVAPASEDRAIIKAFLPVLRPEHMLEQGSNFGAMLDTALAAFGSANQGRALVILTDGEAEAGAWRDRLGALQSRGVRVIAMGIGSPAGAQILSPAGKPLTAATGLPIVTRMNSGPLVDLARQTQGTYLDMARSRELPAIVRAASAEPLRGAAEQSADVGPRDRADQYIWFLIPALLLLAWSAAREFRAKPTLRRRSPQLASHGTLGAAAAAMLVLGVLPHISRAQEPLLTEADLQGEEEPMGRMTRVVAEILRKPRPTASDYWNVMEAGTRYGEIHRGHGHGIEEGLLRDSLAAIQLGRQLDPKFGDWASAEAKLHRLLKKPPSVPPDPGPPDPANEPIGAQGQDPQAGEDAKQGGEEDAPPDKEEPTEGDQGLQNVGGSEKDAYDAAEWRNAALVQPLDQLRKLKAQDNPADLFLLMQKPTPPTVKRGTQTW